MLFPFFYQILFLFNSWFLDTKKYTHTPTQSQPNLEQTNKIHEKTMPKTKQKKNKSKYPYLTKHHRESAKWVETIWQTNKLFFFAFAPYFVLFDDIQFIHLLCTLCLTYIHMIRKQGRFQVRQSFSNLMHIQIIQKKQTLGMALIACKNNFLKKTFFVFMCASVKLIVFIVNFQHLIRCISFSKSIFSMLFHTNNMVYCECWKKYVKKNIVACIFLDSLLIHNTTPKSTGWKSIYWTSTSNGHIHIVIVSLSSLHSNLKFHQNLCIFLSLARWQFCISYFYQFDFT